MEGERYWSTPTTDSGTRRTPPAKNSSGEAVNTPLATKTHTSVDVPENRTSCPLDVR